jgi:DNA-binding transcriptional LysR family regulator
MARPVVGAAHPLDAQHEVDFISCKTYYKDVITQLFRAFFALIVENLSMDSATLKAFVEVARLGSFAHVARDLELDPSSVSRTVAALEQELGVRLFQRTTRKLSLTEAGDAYLARVSPLIDELEQAREEALALSKGMNNKAHGTLRITSSVAFGIIEIVPRLAEFRRLHPQLKVELLLNDANLNLINDRIDLAVRLGAQFEGEAVLTKLMRTRYRVCASPAYIASHGAPSTPADLARHRCLLLTLPEFRHEWHFKGSDGKVESVPVDGDIIISSPLALRSCALDGMGPVLLADWLANEAIEDGALIDLFPHLQVTATSFDTGVWLLYPTRSYLPLKVRLMVDYLKSQCGARQDG